MLKPLHKIKQYLRIIKYYILILLGLIVVSWMIWSKFVRKRIIRSVPDKEFTELRFWILLYICFIYLFVVKTLIKPKESSQLFVWLSELFFTPLKMLDHFMKYNTLIKPYYSKLMYSILTYLEEETSMKIKILYISLDIIPRIILVVFLLVDVFYFRKIELFYKIILLGLLPFFLRYFLYSLKDIYDYWVTTLEEKYDFIFVFEKGYEFVISRKQETSAKYHHEKVSIKEYIEIKHENILENLKDDDFPYEYVHNVFAKENVYEIYRLKKYNDLKKELTSKDFEEIRQLFEELMPKILEMKFTLYITNNIGEFAIIKWPKIVIFSIYFICWFTVLTASYYVYPIEFHLFKYFCSNLMMYLKNKNNDPFSMLYEYSKNKNLITKEAVKILLKAIVNKMFKE